MWLSANIFPPTEQWYCRKIRYKACCSGNHDAGTWRGSHMAFQLPPHTQNGQMYNFKMVFPRRGVCVVWCVCTHTCRTQGWVYLLKSFSFCGEFSWLELKNMSTTNGFFQRLMANSWLSVPYTPATLKHNDYGLFLTPSNEYAPTCIISYSLC